MTTAEKLKALRKSNVIDIDPPGDWKIICSDKKHWQLQAEFSGESEEEAIDKAYAELIEN